MLPSRNKMENNTTNSIKSNFNIIKTSKYFNCIAFEINSYIEILPF